MESSTDRLILEIKGLSKSFPGVKALEDVNFSVREGEVHALVGENGAREPTRKTAAKSYLKANRYQPRTRTTRSRSASQPSTRSLTWRRI